MGRAARSTSARGRRWFTTAAIGVLVVTVGLAPAAAETTAPAASESAAPTEQSTETEPSAGQPTENQQATESPTPTEASSAEEPTTTAAPAPTTIAVTVPASAYLFTQQTLTAVLRGGDGVGIPAKNLLVQRWRPVAGVWGAGQPYTTDATGRVAHTFTVEQGLNRYRVVFAGDAEHAASTSTSHDVAPRRAPSVLSLSGENSVVDEQEVAITIRWRTVDERVITARVSLYSKVRGTTDWKLYGTPLVDKGVATVRVRPRVDTVWRATGAQGVWYDADASPWHSIDNVPPAKPLVLPDGAPRPSISLPAQPRGVGAGLNAVVTTIPDSVWRSMVGRSWHSGCPVGRSGLRLIRMNYWGFDGYRHRGELVVRTSAADEAVAVFRQLYNGGYRVRHMYRVDRFGWSRKLQGADDYKSMAADNTSAFNCRYVVGRPGVRSPHSYGGAIDINTWENPYVSRDGTYPNSWWLSRSHPNVAWRSWSHPVVQAFTGQGFAWGGAYRDYHHFQQ